jgi:hypothetical protein
MNETDEECEEGEGTTPSGFGGGGVAVLFLCEPLPSFSSVSFMFRIETFDWLKSVSIKIRRSERSRDMDHMVGFQIIAQLIPAFSEL